MEIFVRGKEFDDDSRDGFGEETVGKIQLSSLLVELRELSQEISDFAKKTISGSQDFPLDEIKINLEVSAEGKVALLGSGVKAAGGGGITLVYRRSQELSHA